MREDKRWVSDAYELDELDDGAVVVIGQPPEFAIQKRCGEWRMAGFEPPIPLDRLGHEAFPGLVVFTMDGS